MKFEEMYAFIAEEAYAQQTASTKQLLVFLRKRRDGASRIHTQADRISVLNQLRKNVRQPKKFQELTGKLEVLGEILIETGNM